MKVYKSLTEVSYDLRVLELRAEIEEEKLKLHANQLKQELKPKNIISNMFRDLVQKVSVKKKVLKLFNRK